MKIKVVYGIDMRLWKFGLNDNEPEKALFDELAGYVCKSFEFSDPTRFVLVVNDLNGQEVVIRSKEDFQAAYVSAKNSGQKSMKVFVHHTAKRETAESVGDQKPQIQKEENEEEEKKETEQPPPPHHSHHGRGRCGRGGRGFRHGRRHGFGHGHRRGWRGHGRRGHGRRGFHGFYVESRAPQKDQNELCGNGGCGRNPFSHRPFGHPHPYHHHGGAHHGQRGGHGHPHGFGHGHYYYGHHHGHCDRRADEEEEEEMISPEPFEYTSELVEIMAMGFDDVHQIRELLNQHGGSKQLTVQALVLFNKK